MPGIKPINRDFPSTNLAPNHLSLQHEQTPDQ